MRLDDGDMMNSSASSATGPFSSFLKSANDPANFFMSRSLLTASMAAAASRGGEQGSPTAAALAAVNRLGGSDKRNRNPNWTDAEIMRFLEILQEEDVLRDLLAQRNKQVFLYVAQRLCAEGADKSWDQCRIKLKNLKSQYRYVKERIPEVASLDLEDDDVLKRLMNECQSKGISPSSIKHLRFLKRFLNRMSSRSSNNTFGGEESNESLRNNAKMQMLNHKDSDGSTHGLLDEKDESVSPPSTPLPQKEIRIIPSEVVEVVTTPPEPKRRRVQTEESNEDNSGGDLQHLPEGFRIVERFNQKMMEQFLEHQRRMQESYHRWELERQRLHEMALERMRQEAREHEKVMFGMFVQVMSECNSALTGIMVRSQVQKQQQRYHQPKTEANGDIDTNDSGEHEENEEEEEDEEEIETQENSIKKETNKS